VVRVLHVVTLSADGRELLLGASPDGRPSHSVPVDARLTRALRGEDPDGGAGSELQLSPRDIQSRLRRGESVEAIAVEAGVPVARIERYAGPVHSERAQILSDAQASFLVRPRSGRSGHPLGEAVAANLAATAFARPETEAWSVVRDEDGAWSLRLRVTVRGRTRTARWRWSPSRRELTALDAYGTQLGFVDPATSPPAPLARLVPSPPAKKVPAKKVPAKKVPAKKSSRSPASATKEQKKAAPTTRTRPPASSRSAKRRRTS
jgi:hypothetical protein